MRPSRSTTAKLWLWKIGIARSSCSPTGSLKPSRDSVRGLVRDGFKLPVGEQDDRAMPIFHSQSFAVVDREGRIRGVYDALTDEGRKDLHAMLASVAAEPAP